MKLRAAVKEDGSGFISTRQQCVMVRAGPLRYRLLSNPHEESGLGLVTRDDV